MDLTEFSKLKEGDEIENPAGGSYGVVHSVEPMGVRIRWHSAGKQPKPHQMPPEGTFAPTWFYSVQGTAWFNWNKVEPEESADAPEQAQT